MLTDCMLVAAWLGDGLLAQCRPRSGVAHKSLAVALWLVLPLGAGRGREMSEQNLGEQDADAARGARDFAFWVSVLVATSAALALALAVTTPARSGPFCQTACITYPYTDAAAFVPRDYLWMYPATVMALLFVALIACVSHFAPARARLYGQVGLAFAVISATALVLDRVFGRRKPGPSGLG